MKQIITDTFETLGGVAKSAGQQIVAGTKKAGEDIVEQLGITKTPASPTDGQKKEPTEEQLEKMRQSSKKRTVARYKEIQAQIKAIQKDKAREIPKQVSGKPGFSEEKAVKQLEEKPSSVPTKSGTTAGKGKLPPLPVRRESQKAERFRGVSG